MPICYQHKKDEKMTAIHEAQDECSAENPLFHEDEVDIYLYSKIGVDRHKCSDIRRSYLDALR